MNDINTALLIINKTTNQEQLFKTCIFLVDRYKHEIILSSQETLLLYSYYKQALVGDAPDDRPSLLYPIAYTKWSAWYKLKGLSKIKSMENYTNIVKSLINSYINLQKLPIDSTSSSTSSSTPSSTPSSTSSSTSSDAPIFSFRSSPGSTSGYSSCATRI